MVGMGWLEMSISAIVSIEVYSITREAVSTSLPPPPIPSHPLYTLSISSLRLPRLPISQHSRKHSHRLHIHLRRHRLIRFRQLTEQFKIINIKTRRRCEEDFRFFVEGVGECVSIAMSAKPVHSTRFTSLRKVLLRCRLGLRCRLVKKG